VAGFPGWEAAVAVHCATEVNYDVTGNYNCWDMKPATLSQKNSHRKMGQIIFAALAMVVIILRVDNCWFNDAASSTYA